MIPPKRATLPCAARNEANFGHLVVWCFGCGLLKRHRLIEHSSESQAPPKSHRRVDRKMLLRAILPDLGFKTQYSCMGPQPCVCPSRFGMKIPKTDRDLCKTGCWNWTADSENLAAEGDVLRGSVHSRIPNQTTKNGPTSGAESR